MGAKNVIAVGPLENKREKAMELGATHAVASAEEAQQRPSTSLAVWAQRRPF